MSKSRGCKAGGDALDAAAGNGLLDRRALLGRGMALAGAIGAGIGPSAAGAEPPAEPLADDPWSLEFGERTLPYQVRSKFEAKVVRTLSNPKNELRNSHSRTPHHMLEGTTTPNGLHFTINHGGIPDIDPEKHRLVIHGLVKRPLVFTLETLSRYPMTSRVTFVECGGNSAPMFSPEPLQADRAGPARARFLRGVDRGQLVDPARGNRHRSPREMVHRRGRRTRRI